MGVTSQNSLTTYCVFAGRHSLLSDQVKHPESNSPRRLPVVHNWRGRQITVQCPLNFLAHTVFTLNLLQNILQAPNLVNCIFILAITQVNYALR